MGLVFSSRHFFLMLCNWTVSVKRGIVNRSSRLKIGFRKIGVLMYIQFKKIKSSSDKLHSS